MTAALATPLFEEIDYGDPATVFAHFKHQPWAMLFESANRSLAFENTNRYSYIVCAPLQTFTVKNSWHAETRTHISEPFMYLKQQLAQYHFAHIPGLPPFQGGVAGLFAYEACQYLEDLPSAAEDDLQVPDLALGFYSWVISFDHLQQRAYIVATGLPAEDEKTREKNARTTIKELITYWQNRHETVPEVVTAVCNEANLASNFTREKYLKAIEQAKAYIRAGDIFEINLSQRFSTLLPDTLTPYDLYLRLKSINPAPFAAYLNLGALSIVSASPERFLLLNQQQITTRPIKGTMPRSATPNEDQRLAETLLTSQKDRAENIMIVDLMRNDLSKVCDDDSVIVEKLCGLESFPTVHHLVSVIKGLLSTPHTAVDLLTATLPGGSITGAPKIRAQTLIAELEPTARGAYTGNLGYISFSGDMDLSIVIRTFVIKNQFATFQAGGAIVLASDCQQEYQETLDKIAALKRALMSVPPS